MNNKDKSVKNILDKDFIPPSYFKGIEKEEEEEEEGNEKKMKKNSSIFYNLKTYYDRYKEYYKYLEQNVMTDYIYNPKSKLSNNLWPIGNDSNYIDITPLQELSFDPDILLDLTHVARDYFKLSTEAVDSILKKRTSLFHQVAVACQRQRDERFMEKREKKCVKDSLIESEEELYFFEVKLGVYYLLQRGTVIKFLTDVKHYSEFVIETGIGLSINSNNDKVKGAVGIKTHCPQGLCVEMEFAGVTLYDVINDYIVDDSSDNSEKYKKRLQRQIYAVKMLSVSNQLPYEKNQYFNSQIIDTFYASRIIDIMREKLLNDLPFVMIELINVITRISRHGLVNPDIKLDNIVIDGLTGQPKMIDFGLAFPEGKRSPLWDEDYEPSSSTIKYILYKSHHIAIEYAKGEVCQRSIMTYSLCILFLQLLLMLKQKTNGSKHSKVLNIDLLINNKSLVSCIYQGLSEDPKNRPNLINTIIPLIVDSCFPHS